MLGPVPRNRTRQPPRLHSRRRRSMLVCRPRLRNGRTAGFRQSATRTRLSGSNGNHVLTPIEVAPPENITSPRLRPDPFAVLHDSRQHRRTHQAAPPSPPRACSHLPPPPPPPLPALPTPGPRA